jgi:soluble lytic murein transglycosylase
MVKFHRNLSINQARISASTKATHSTTSGDKPKVTMNKILVRKQHIFGVTLLLQCSVALLLLNPVTSSTTADASSNSHTEQQQLYKQTLSAIKKGHKTRTEQGLTQLENYSLYPYLLAAKLQRDLRKLPYQRVDQFIADYGQSVAGKKLRKKWLKTLAAKKQWPQYLRYYEDSIANNELRCWQIEALHSSGHTELAINQTADIWLSAKSQPNACDPVFKRWQQTGNLSDQLVWQRTNMALQANNTLLARYLSNHAAASLKPYTRRLISVHRDPRRLSKQQDFAEKNSYTAAIVSHGLLRLAPINIELATKLWIDYRGNTDFTAPQFNAIRDKLARQVIASDSGQGHALAWLIQHDPNAEDSYLLEWRIRLALKQQQWNQASHWITLLPEELQQKPRWRYWLAKSLRSLDQQPEKSSVLLQQLALERTYYGFLAADLVDKSYGFNHRSMQAGTALNQTNNIAAVDRAQQFFQMGDMLSARREWNDVTNKLSELQLAAATNIAHQWGWHQQAIHTTIKAGEWNDLSIRFPLAYQHSIIGSAKSATINPEWVYAITRQESSFAQDAYSSAGARGLMQLRPSTAQQVARQIGIPYRNQDLFEADKNIELGSQYLKQLLDDFSGNRILATAAYNAGPHRVKRWLKNQASAMPMDIWIETLPFHETRNYVQNVLAFAVIYGHRLGTDAPLFNPQEQLINLP